ncbi:sugar phosphate isomerase/epimerase [Pseudoclavibacter chungangensis]|uniref:Sugar phosphate isomerase/epimerase n=1 Tax=Pseudoclavibacter chungangensis TaxID=587635 RepID=A0A7J5BNP3_9MICO|nr:sugar phosphate isomerase/epimerase family protein [Pseudoclavibacter chungangensis]KAB1654027.1 sugar phosphate isomerase/epimerase [Pseudoclavibacter chungangensis]NYJ66067.1 sugar phosphate isomerase/epimerase [Pseudoclavibacter chungangensis]
MSIELSLNQATARPYPLTDTAEAAAAAGIRHIGLWIEPVEELGLERTARLLADTGLSVSSVCRAGFVADKRGAELVRALDDTRRALDLCAAVGAPALTFIAGATPADDRDVRAAEGRVRDALEQLAPHAAETGVRLALEPIHPLFVTSRSAVTTVRQGLRVIEGLPSEVAGLVVDAYAVFWDPELHESLHEAGDRIAAYQVDDFALPLALPENMNSRLLPGEGEIDLPAITASVRGAGFRGPIEVEIFQEALWREPLETIVARTVASFERAIAAPVTEREGHA